jgi:hypothetical protein
MPTGLEVQAYRDVGRIADALERIANALEAKPSGLPEPPPELADAWRRFQSGEDVEPHELRALDEWRASCAADAGF